MAVRQMYIIGVLLEMLLAWVLPGCGTVVTGMQLRMEGNLYIHREICCGFSLMLLWWCLLLSAVTLWFVPFLNLIPLTLCIVYTCAWGCNFLTMLARIWDPLFWMGHDHEVDDMEESGFVAPDMGHVQGYGARYVATKPVGATVTIHPVQK